MADPILLLEFPMGRPHSESGKERGWLEWDNTEMWGRTDGCWALPLPHESICNMSNFYYRKSLGLLPGFLIHIWIMLDIAWIFPWIMVRWNNNIFHIKSIICRHFPFALKKGHFCDTYAHRAGKAIVCHGGCQAGFPSNQRVYQLISLIIEGERRGTYHWSQLATMKTSTIVAFSGTWSHISNSVKDAWRMLAVFCEF